MAEMKFIKELLSTDKAVEGQLLIVRKIHDTLIEEVEKRLIPRSEASFVAGPGMIPGSSLDIDRENVGTLSVRQIAEGADIPLDNTEYDSINVKPVKFGVSIRITRELMEDAKWNLLEQNIRRAGRRFAENENRLVLVQLDTAANTVVGTAAITIANITRAMQHVEDNDFVPTTMLVGNEVLTDLRNIDTFVEADKLGSREMLERGFVGRLFGMNVARFSATGGAAPASTHNRRAYVFDNTEAYMIAEKRPISIERFELPSNDMSAAAITQRIAVRAIRTGAIALITTT